MDAKTECLLFSISLCFDLNNNIRYFDVNCYTHTHTHTLLRTLNNILRIHIFTKSFCCEIETIITLIKIKFENFIIFSLSFRFTKSFYYKKLFVFIPLKTKIYYDGKGIRKICMRNGCIIKYKIYVCLRVTVPYMYVCHSNAFDCNIFLIGDNFISIILRWSYFFIKSKFKREFVFNRVKMYFLRCDGQLSHDINTIKHVKCYFHVNVNANFISINF